MYFWVSSHFNGTEKFFQIDAFLIIKRKIEKYGILSTLFTRYYLNEQLKFKICNYNYRNKFATFIFVSNY